MEDVDRKKGKEREEQERDRQVWVHTGRGCHAHLEALFQVGREEGWEP